MYTWWDRAEERAAEAAEPVAGESAAGFSDQVNRSAVEVWGFLTGVFLSISLCLIRDCSTQFFLFLQQMHFKNTKKWKIRFFNATSWCYIHNMIYIYLCVCVCVLELESYDYKVAVVAKWAALFFKTRSSGFEVSLFLSLKQTFHLIPYL